MLASRFRLATLLPLVTAAVAGCGGDTVSVRGSLAGQDPEAQGWTVWAVEAEREAPVQGGEFELPEMVPGPVTLELREGGRAVGRIELPNLAAGSSLRMEGLRVEPRSGRAFPSRVELDGAKTVWINGIRMAAPGAVPDPVDAPGVVLAAAEDGSALLVRPDDEALPDLRVVLTPTTQWIAGGAPVNPRVLEEGDSVRVQGGPEQGYVVAAMLTLPALATALGEGGSGDSLAMETGGPPLSTAAGASEPGEGDGDGDDEAREESGGNAPVAVAAAPAVRPAATAPRGRGRGHDDRGPGRGRGQGKGKKDRG